MLLFGSMIVAFVFIGWGGFAVVVRRWGCVLNVGSWYVGELAGFACGLFCGGWLCGLICWLVCLDVDLLFGFG